MIVNRRLIYIQMQKTGCTSIEKILENLVDAKPDGPKHGRLTFDPGDRLVFGFAIRGVGTFRSGLTAASPPATCACG